MFRMRIKLPSGAIINRVAIGSRDMLMDAAYDEFGACGVSVHPL